MTPEPSKIAAPDRSCWSPFHFAQERMDGLETRIKELEAKNAAYEKERAETNRLLQILNRQNIFG